MRGSAQGSASPALRADLPSGHRLVLPVSWLGRVEARVPPSEAAGEEVAARRRGASGYDQAAAIGRVRLWCRIRAAPKRLPVSLRSGRQSGFARPGAIRNTVPAPRAPRGGRISVACGGSMRSPAQRNQRSGRQCGAGPATWQAPLPPGVERERVAVRGEASWLRRPGFRPFPRGRRCRWWRCRWRGVDSRR